MKLYDENQLDDEKTILELLEKIKNGAIIIYPTDTVMGIGCDATNSGAVEKIMNIKKRSKNTFLSIAPSLEWIKQNAQFQEKHLKQFHLPGPYSFIVTLKNTSLVSSKIIGENKSIGLRIPDCKFTEIVKKYEKPIISTSVNISGQPAATSIEDIDQEILSQADIIIRDSKPLKGTASELYDIRNEELKRLR